GHPVPLALEQDLEIVPQAGLVLDEKYGRLLTHGSSPPGPVASSTTLSQHLTDRQAHAERAPLTEPAVHRDGPVGGLDDPKRDPPSDTPPLLLDLGGEEGIEAAPQMLLCDPAVGIGVDVLHPIVGETRSNRHAPHTR